MERAYRQRLFFAFCAICLNKKIKMHYVRCDVWGMLFAKISK